MKTTTIRTFGFALLLICATAAQACNSGGDADEEQEAEASGEEAPDESPTSPPEQVAEPEFHRVWIGLRCDVPQDDGSPNATREFSFYVDGTEMQRLETSCAPIADDAPPNGGQFAVEIESGERVLRVQDDTGDAHTEETFYVRGDTWLTVNHRVLAEGQGFLTSVDASMDPPAFDMVDSVGGP